LHCEPGRRKRGGAWAGRHFGYWGGVSTPDEEVLNETKRGRIPTKFRLADALLFIAGGKDPSATSCTNDRRPETSKRENEEGKLTYGDVILLSKKNIVRLKRGKRENILFTGEGGKKWS